MTSLSVQHNADGTVTVRVGRKLESVSKTDKTKGELYDAIKYAAIAMGASPSEEWLIRAVSSE